MSHHDMSCFKPASHQHPAHIEKEPNDDKQPDNYAYNKEKYISIFCRFQTSSQFLDALQEVCHQRPCNQSSDLETINGFFSFKSELKVRLEVLVCNKILILATVFLCEFYRI